MAFDPAQVLPTPTFLARWTNAEYLALGVKRAADIATNKVGNSKNWDIVVADSNLRLDSQKVATLKAALVADGILTQARADAIFAAPDPLG